MPNLLNTGAVWLSDQQKEHCGTEYQYDRDGYVFSIVLVPDVRRDQQRSDAPEDEAILARTEVFHAKVADLEIEEGGGLFLPEAGHRIYREIDGEEPQEYVVFPSFGQQVYKFTDPNKKILRIYAVASSELATLDVTAAGGQEAQVHAMLADIRGDLEQEASGNVVKVMRQAAYVSTKQLIAAGVTELERNATIATAQYGDWSIDLSLSRWGAGRVTLELKRRPISTLTNKERNAAV